MSRRTLLLFLAVVFCIGATTACSLLSPETSFVAAHEPLDKGRPLCSSCHENETMKGGLKTFASFDHTSSFVKDHRFQANRDSSTCAACHAQAFCSDCHGGKTAMRPSVKLGDRPDRANMPHRGNYLTLHRMDGRMDPSSCFKCHGRANNDKCISCHK